MEKCFWLKTLNGFCDFFMIFKEKNRLTMSKVFFSCSVVFTSNARIFNICLFPNALKTVPETFRQIIKNLGQNCPVFLSLFSELSGFLLNRIQNLFCKIFNNLEFFFWIITNLSLIAQIVLKFLQTFFHLAQSNWCFQIKIFWAGSHENFFSFTTFFSYK